MFVNSLLSLFAIISYFYLFKCSVSDALNLSSAMWFAWGVLLNSGIGEGKYSTENYLMYFVLEPNK